MRRLVLYSLAASILYFFAGAGFEWASHVYFTGTFRVHAPDVLMLLFPLIVPCQVFSWGFGLGSPSHGVTILVCWFSGFLVCFSIGLWIRGLSRRRQKASYLVKSAGALLVFAGLLAGWGNRDRIWLNLQMRNSDLVRADCLKLLVQRKSTVKEESRGMPVSRTNLPTSFITMGATSAWVTHDSVRINFLRKDNWGGSAWGFLYDPHRTYLTEMSKWPPVKNTLYQDFYEFRVLGE